MAINEILNDYNYKSCKRKEHVKIQVNKVKLNHIKSKSSSRHFTNPNKVKSNHIKRKASSHHFISPLNTGSVPKSQSFLGYTVISLLPQFPNNDLDYPSGPVSKQELETP